MKSFKLDKIDKENINSGSILRLLLSIMTFVIIVAFDGGAIIGAVVGGLVWGI